MHIPEKKSLNAKQALDTLNYYNYTFPDSNELTCQFQIIKRINAHEAIVMAPTRLAGNLKPSNAQQWKWYGNEDFLQLSFPQCFKIIRLDKKINIVNVNSIEHLQIMLTDKTVIGIELVNRKAQTESNLLGHDFSLNLFNKVKAKYPYLKGSGIKLSVKEDLMDSNDLDLKNRYFNSKLSAKAFNSHSTSMTTIIAGAGNTYKSSLGIAPQLMYGSSTYDSLQPNALHILKAEKTNIQNHSYGVGIENYYGSDAVEYDLQTYLAKEILHVFSAGNSGNVMSTNGLYANIPNVANLTGTFKLAKNVITVGATDSFNILEPKSSRGPAFDGRIKPDVLAFGQDGSSGAAAAVSGLSALCYEQYLITKNKWPSAALIRSAIITAADRKSESGIKFSSGFGTINALQTLNILNEQQYIEDSIQQGQVKLIPLFVPPNLKSLRATLVWHDTSAAVLSQKALINDLDFELEDANNQIYLPWVLNAYPHPDSLNQIAKRKVDTLNNVEHITLTLPTSGNFILKVKAKSIQSLQQHFALTYHFDTLHKFYFNYPTKVDQFIPKEKHLLRWQTNLNDAIGKFYISYNLGASWQLLKDSLNLSTGYCYFQTKDTNCFLLFKIESNTGSFYSDTIPQFEIVKQNIEYVCNDSTMITWPKVKNCKQYEISSIGNQYLESFRITTDTSLSIKNKVVVQISIAPVVSSKRLQSSYLINSENQGVNCYYNAFIAYIVDENKARIKLSLSTKKNVNTCVIEKRIGANYVPIFSSKVSESLNFEYTDAELLEGINSYRALIILDNQTSVYTELSEIKWLYQSPFIIFPNPLKQNSTLNVWNQKEDLFSVNIYNALGEIVYTKAYKNIYNEITGLKLNPGLYLIEIQNNSKTLTKKKLLVI